MRSNHMVLKPATIENPPKKPYTNDNLPQIPTGLSMLALKSNTKFMIPNQTQEASQEDKVT